jgi:hypothetical protein
VGLRSVAELDAVFAEATSGGGSSMLDQRSMVQLLGYAMAKDWVVDAIEVYELKDGLEIPRVDFGLYGGDLVSETADMSFEQSMAHILGAVDFILSAIEETSMTYGFLVWLAPIQAWRDASPA